MTKSWSANRKKKASLEGQRLHQVGACGIHKDFGFYYSAMEIYGRILKLKNNKTNLLQSNLFQKVYFCCWMKIVLKEEKYRYWEVDMGLRGVFRDGDVAQCYCMCLSCTRKTLGLIPSIVNKTKHNIPIRSPTYKTNCLVGRDMHF